MTAKQVPEIVRIRREEARKRKSAPDMLQWQYKNLLACLGQVTLHASDDSCPCNQVHLGDDGEYNAEYCLGKHLIDTWSLCLETALMDEPNRDMLEAIGVEASEFLEKAKTIYCKGGEWPDLAQWARDARKKLEPIYYSCQVKAKLRDSEPTIRVVLRERGEAKMNESESVAEGLRKSMAEELAAARVYQLRAKEADEQTAKVYQHVIDEESHHYEEFKKRLSELGGSRPRLIVHTHDAELEAVGKALEHAEEV